MYELIRSIVERLELADAYIHLLTSFLMIMIVLFIAYLADVIAKKIILQIVLKIILKTKNKWDDVFYKNKLFHAISHIAPVIVIHIFSYAFGNYQHLVKRFALAYMVIVGLNIMEKFLNSINDIYRTYEIAKEKPIKGYIQVVKIVTMVIGFIIFVGAIMDRSPWKILSGFGAMTAIIMLVFKDSILGFVAGIQLVSNDMVKIGDWLEMPKFDADGDVIEVTLTTVKVQNWDKTISYIPVYALITNSFKNWKGMSVAGGRRIKRSINIDASSIKFCNDEMIRKYKKIDFLNDYINEKEKDIDTHNKNLKSDLNELVNGRRLTNIGTFRAYVYNYLKNHPKVHQNMTLLVRQLEPTEHGVPIQIYCFSNDTAWANYEGIQGDIFDHILAIVPEFGLKVFQNPSGNDFQKLNKEI